MEKEITLVNETDVEKLQKAYDIIENVATKGKKLDDYENVAINKTLENLKNVIDYKNKQHPEVIIDGDKTLETLIRESMESYHNGRRVEQISMFRVYNILSPTISTIIVNAIEKDGNCIAWGTGIPLEILNENPRYQKEFNELVKRGYINWEV